MTVSPEKIAEMLKALEGFLPLRRNDTEDYAEIDGPAMQAMCTRPDALMLLNDLPAILTELTTLRSKLSGITDETSSWQPIETAPKDGTTILMGKWHDGERYWIASGCIEDGKYWCDFSDDYFDPFSHQNPTHWRPLGAPPMTNPETSGGETGWLIERGDSDPAKPWYWAAGQRDAERSSAWTQNHMQAIRFARKDDAEKVQRRLFKDIAVRVAAHEWGN